MRSEVVTRDLTWLMYIVCPSKAAAVQFVDGKILYSNADNVFAVQIRWFWVIYYILTLNNVLAVQIRCVCVKYYILTLHNVFAVPIRCRWVIHYILKLNNVFAVQMRCFCVKILYINAEQRIRSADTLILSNILYLTLSNVKYSNLTSKWNYLSHER